MTWTWGQSPSTSSTGGRRDALRSLIRDTDSSRQLLSDEELTFFYSQERNIYRAAGAACLALADGSKVQKSVGDLSIGAVSESYQALAREYRRRADMDATVYAGGISSADKLTQDQDTDRVRPAFSRSLHGTPDTSSGSST